MDFTYHRNNHWTPLVTHVIGFLAVGEAIDLHVALVSHHPLIAWPLPTAISVAGLAWMLVDLGAIRSRPIRIEDRQLVLRRGMRNPIVVDRDEIMVIVAEEAPAFQSLPDLGVFAVGHANVIVSLRALRRVGRKQVARIAVFVGDPDAFVAAAPAHSACRHVASQLGSAP